MSRTADDARYADHETRIDALELGGGGSGGAYVSVTSYGAGEGGDDTLFIRDAVAAAVANGTRRIHFPAGEYVVDRGAVAADGHAVDFPSNFAITGEGEGKSIIWQTGVSGVGGADEFACFGVVDGTDSVIFQGLHFKGENGVGASGFVFVVNNQAACIDILLTTSKDITIQECYFDNLWGFSVHDRGSDNLRTCVYNCKMRYCSNGLNVNSEGSLQIGNQIFNSEGIESSGAHTVIAHNYFKDVYLQAISAGGTGDARPGVIVANNVVDGGLALGESLAGGILVGEGFTASLVANNTVSGCSYGIESTAGELEAPSTNNLFIGNNVSGNDVGFVFSAGADDALLSGNVGVDCDIGISLSGVSGCSLVGNVFSGTTQDLTANNSPGLRLSANQFLTNIVYFAGTTTLTNQSNTMVSGADIVEHFQKISGSGSKDYGHFKRLASGKLFWGDPDLEFDTTLERASAGILKATGKLTATAGLGVGNSASGSTLGTVVKKMEVFDAAGSSLGFVAIYNSIT